MNLFETLLNYRYQITYLFTLKAEILTHLLLRILCYLKVTVMLAVIISHFLIREPIDDKNKTKMFPFELVHSFYSQKT